MQTGTICKKSQSIFLRKIFHYVSLKTFAKFALDKRDVQMIALFFFLFEPAHDKTYKKTMIALDYSPELRLAMKVMVSIA